MEEDSPPDFKKIPIEPEEDMLMFIMEYSKLSDWEKDIISIVREETLYFFLRLKPK